MAQDLLDAVYGCIIGGAIGDALGAPVEGMYWTEIREKYGRVNELLPSAKGNTGLNYGGLRLTPQAGWFSDDTTMRHYLALTIVRKRGRVTPDDLRDVLVEKLNPDRVWVNERALMWKLKAGVDPWESGRGMVPAGCATMMIAPVGIINAGNPAQAYQDGWNIASINQEGHNRDGAATMAAGVAAAFLPGATVENVLETMTRYSSYYIRRGIELTMDLARTSSSIDEFAEKYYARMLDWSWPIPPGHQWNKNRFFSGNSIELIPITMAILYLCGGDVNQSMIEAASFGRDCDTTASMAGSIAGALHGAGAIRQDWIETVERANQDFFQEVEGNPQTNFFSIAQRLVEALQVERQAAQDRLVMLDRILDAVRKK